MVGAHPRKSFRDYNNQFAKNKLPNLAAHFKNIASKMCTDNTDGTYTYLGNYTAVMVQNETVFINIYIYI